jgi:hypothetical protein
VPLVQSPTELTTSATDALLAMECVLVIAWLPGTTTPDHWRNRLWCWFFGFFAIASFLGATAHGLEMPDSTRGVLWKPLYLSLGIAVALFVVGAIADWRGQTVAKRLVPWSIGAGAAFLGLTELLDRAFIVFVVYEAAALAGALAVYIFLAVTGRLKGAAVIALGILLSLAAAVAQASDVSFHILFPFDHNGAFHLLQMLSTATLAVGLRLGMEPGEGGDH